MKIEMRRALAQESFEEKIRKVAQLIQLSVAVRPERSRKVKESQSGRRAARGAVVPSG